MATFDAEPQQITALKSNTIQLAVTQANVNSPSGQKNIYVSSC